MVPCALLGGTHPAPQKRSAEANSRGQGSPEAAVTLGKEKTARKQEEQVRDAVTPEKKPQA